MRQRIPVVLMVAAFLMLLAPARDAMAAISCSDCQSYCDSVCAFDGKACFMASADCGTFTCNYVCSSGPWQYTDCGCPSGSPIFRKRPTQPAPSSKSTTQDPKQAHPATPGTKPAAESKATPETKTAPCP